MITFGKDHLDVVKYIVERDGADVNTEGSGFKA